MWENASNMLSSEKNLYNIVLLYKYINKNKIYMQI